jgi:hypothetical protein
VEVRLTFSNGTPVAGAPVTWTITRDIGPGEPPLLNAPSALTDADGRARVSVYAQPGNSGTFTVHATLGGVGADVPLTVQGGPVVTVTLVYGTVGPIVVGSAQQVEVYARDATGAYRPDVPVNVVGIEGGGTVTSFAPFTSPYNVPGRVGTWTLSTVTAGVRTYPSLAPVVQRLHLQVDGVDAVAQLTPLPGPTAGGAAAPELVLLSLPGDTLTVYARPVDAYGNWTSYPNRVPQAPHTFTIEDPSVATVSASGMVTAVADGSTRLFVTIPYNSGTSSVVYTDTVNVLVGGFEGVRAPAADRLRPGSPASRPRASRGAAPARGRREQ